MLARCDAAVGDLVRAAEGFDAFLERYAVIVLSDHGQTLVTEIARLGDRFRHEPETLVAASNRAAHVYRLGLERAARWPSASTASRRQACSSARRVRPWLAGKAPSLRLEDASGARARAATRRSSTSRRAPAAALRCPNAGEVVVSASEGWEFEDLGGRHHLGGARTARSSRATRSFP